MSSQFAPDEHGSTVRCAIVTGATRGVGARVARRLAREGYRLTVAARDEAMLTLQAARLIEEFGTEVLPVAVDLGVAEDVGRLVAEHAGRFGRLDLLVMAAGHGNVATLVRMSTVDDDVAGTRSACLLVAECLPMLRSAAEFDHTHGSRMVAITSDETGTPAGRRAQKDALAALCQSVNEAESGAGIIATTITVGQVDEKMTMWRHGQVAPQDMVISADVADVVVALTHLSADLVAPNIVLVRKAGRVQPI